MITIRYEPDDKGAQITIIAGTLRMVCGGVGQDEDLPLALTGIDWATEPAARAMLRRAVRKGCAGESGEIAL